MAVKRKILAALAALALAGGIAATAVHDGTASAGGPAPVTGGTVTGGPVTVTGSPVTGNGGGGGVPVNPGADVWPYDAD